jgi:UDP-N-acetylglucosamine diphosphorylase / glucose-1-phosphate thymidylyltransferase / UDP-N-acetylgalactosamine diphosphorylase / glucosamine-1-phosphate N-acetyltransferase / galactosamine-1-phosphate N-acetyltransferase
VLGGCVGHNCRLGAGLVVHPGRTIESDTILIPDESHFFLKKSVRFADSHHHLYPDKVTFYPEYRMPPDDYGQEMDRGTMADGEQVTAFDVV